MLNVEYNFTIGDEDHDNAQIDYTSPTITIVFNCNGIKVSFYPETLGESEKWSELVLAVKNNTKYSICSEGTNSNYTIEYNNNMLDLSVAAYGSGTVGELNVSIEMTEEIKQTLNELEKLAKCVENKVAYE